MNTAEYLVKKIEELGVNDFFGLPGDYNFSILSAINDNPNTNWIGCTNELNAGYAADGYARERGYGALVTTYGVGELSAINAIAGSFAENVSVINIVGVPSSKVIADKTRVHHNFQGVQPFVYSDAYKNVTETTAFLNRDNAKMEIDRVLKTLVKERKPVYIAIPMDIAKMEISDKDIDYSWESNEDVLNKVVNLIAEKIDKSKKPVIIGDTLIKRFDARIEYKEFVEKTGIPATNFLMGTNLLDSSIANNLGTYFSTFENSVAQKYLEEADCLIAIGTIYSDLNSFGMNLPNKIKFKIQINGTYTIVDGIRYDDIKMSDVLEQLSETVETKSFEIEKSQYFYEKPNLPDGKLSSEYIYPRLQEFLKENDILIAETGIIPFGVSKMNFPQNTELVTQSLWASIGWATPAALGTCLASPSKRVILFTGEGSHQISAMELGNLLRYGVRPVVIVLNNKGYSTERILSGDFECKFNDVLQMNYSKFARVFEGDIWSTRVETQDDFDKALKVTQIMNKLCFIEICTEMDDIPELAKDLILSLKKDAEKFSCSISEPNDNTKTLPKISKGIMNFATKVHESLR